MSELDVDLLSWSQVATADVQEASPADSSDELSRQIAVYSEEHASSDSICVQPASVTGANAGFSFSFSSVSPWATLAETLAVVEQQQESTDVGMVALRFSELVQATNSGVAKLSEESMKIVDAITGNHTEILRMPARQAATMLKIDRFGFVRKSSTYLACLALMYNAGQRCMMMRDKRACLQCGGRLKRFRLVLMADETPMKLVTKAWDWRVADLSRSKDGESSSSSEDEAGIADSDATNLLNSTWKVDLIMHANGKTIMNQYPTSSLLGSEFLCLS